MSTSNPSVEYLVVDTTAFIDNVPLQDIGKHIVTCQEVIDEITNKRQLRRLIVLPYNLIIKNVDPDNLHVVTEFSKKTGDYPSLSATDLKVLALTYQLEKEQVGTDHLRTEPVTQRTVNIMTCKDKDLKDEVVGFYKPKKEGNEYLLLDENLEQLDQDLQTLDFKSLDEEDCDSPLEDGVSDSDASESGEDDDVGWITPLNISKAKKSIDGKMVEKVSVKVACITTDFAMQNVLKQMDLNVSALDGRIIKQIKTYLLRCYTCFKTTSIMTKVFCSKCGNKTLKRVAVTVDSDGNQKIHINARRPLTSRGKKFSLPTIKGGKHSNNPLLVEDQPFPDQRPTRLAKTKTNPLNDDYIAGFSPFVMRDVTSKSAQLKIRPHSEVKHWMRKNPNEAVRRRK